jgi:hypothetical protein
MKALLLKANIYFYALLFAASFIGCQKSPSSDNTTPGGTVTISGKWKITLFQEDEKNETAHFTGYTFDFKDNGTIVAVKGSTSLTGKHYEGLDDSKLKYIIDFGTTSPLNELNEDWEILTQSTTKFQLKHVSGGNGGIDNLVFEK